MSIEHGAYAPEPIDELWLDFGESLRPDALPPEEDPEVQRDQLRRKQDAEVLATAAMMEKIARFSDATPVEVAPDTSSDPATKYLRQRTIEMKTYIQSQLKKFSEPEKVGQRKRIAEREKLEMIAHLTKIGETSPDTAMIMTGFQARALAYVLVDEELAEGLFTSRKVDDCRAVTERMSNIARGDVENIQAQICTDEAMARKLEMCLPMIVAKNEDIELARRITCVELYKIGIWKKSVALDGSSGDLNDSDIIDLLGRTKED